MELTREQALALLRQYNEEPFHLRHALTVEAVMNWFARELGYGEEAAFWAQAGLLHDLDFERYPEEHCVKVREIMEARGLDSALIHAVVSHGWGMTEGDAQPEHEMERVLFAVDELTGLIRVPRRGYGLFVKRRWPRWQCPPAPGRCSVRGRRCAQSR